ncbi:tRNA lysidine(34) synthetase TilS [Vibrio rumoiensis]|uniref:tRNA(Ile)-lysidine synthase n=1 Tax=Vibrio rumoiensis 1S-45 TaxID=1188252 RepID=A0A1E5E0D0_9VIBR|nr:tRNA lysidine(34) synthetase TilS [Vibrio rumoiensis]OEF23956.1 tRNA lysidine(34) synthetase TilS [Vibrio rumoiensis 1S-45]
MLYPFFSQQLNQHASVGTHFVVALSGGLDSRVLLHLLGRFKQEHPQFTYQAVHIHHGLSSNADHWLTSCQKWAKQADIPFSYEKVKVEQGSRVSLEQAARNARYQALDNYIDDNSILLTGQHATDQLETFLLALKRGSGPKGLSAMPKFSSFSNGYIMRPFLSIPRKEMETYAQQIGLQWAEDESNQDTRFDRNFIRHQVTPILQERWPNIEKTIARSASLCAEQELLLQELLNERYRGMIANDGSISIDKLKNQSEAAKVALIRMWLEEQDQLMPSAKQMEHIWQDVALAKTDSAPVFRYGQTQIGRLKERLYAFKQTQDLSSVTLEWDIQTPLNLPDNLGQLVLKPVTKDCVFSAEHLSAKSIQTLSLPCEVHTVLVIFNAAGIHAHPESRTHGRALTKLLKEHPIPTWLRHRIPFIVDGSELIAAAGLWVGQSYSGSQYQLIWLDKKPQR